VLAERFAPSPTLWERTKEPIRHHRHVRCASTVADVTVVVPLSCTCARPSIYHVVAVANAD
jgi:hypothetical protein